jgi:hypothetical protein
VADCVQKATRSCAKLPGELADLPDELSWEYAKATARDKIIELHPAGKSLAL